MMPAYHQTPENRVTPKTLLLFFSFLVFSAVFGTLLCGLWLSHFTMRDVLINGLQTDAILEDKYQDADQRFWLKYRFTTLTDDTYLSSIEVTQNHYQAYAIGDNLPMRYAPANPNFNALDLLGDDVRRDVWGMLRLSLFVIVVAIIQAFGWMRTIPRHRLRFWQHDL